MQLCFRKSRFILNIKRNLTLIVSNVSVQNTGGDELAAKTQNPVGAMQSLPFKFSFDYGADNGKASFLNIQPVLPQTIGEWNLIHRITGSGTTETLDT